MLEKLVWERISLKLSCRQRGRPSQGCMLLPVLSPKPPWRRTEEGPQHLALLQCGEAQAGGKGSRG